MARGQRTGTPHIRDVAARANVGVGTVSRVLNGGVNVAEAEQARVLRAIADLGYRPSSLARGLSLGRTNTVGLIAPFFTSPGTTERLRGVTECAGKADRSLMIFNVETRKQRAAALEDFARRDRLDGVLVISLPLADAEVEALAREGLPAVLVNVAHPALSCVVSDDVAGGALATRHLLDRGHTRIAFVGDSPASQLGFTSSEDRRRGYVQALTDAGRGAEAALVRRGTHGRAPARLAAEELLRGPNRPTAIFAASDIQALGVLEAAERTGLRVPGDLAVVGYDDIEIADAVGLTTVRQPLAESGAIGTELLLRELSDPEAERVEIVQRLCLVERQTT